MAFLALGRLLSINQAYFADKVALIWLYLIKMSVILEKKRYLNGLSKSNSVYRGLYSLSLTSQGEYDVFMLCCCKGYLNY